MTAVLTEATAMSTPRATTDRPAPSGGPGFQQAETTALIDAVPVVDVETLGPLVDLVGADRMRHAAGKFWAECDELIAAIRDAATPKDRRTAAHTLKGAAATIGAARLAALGHALEGENIALSAALTRFPDIVAQSRAGLDGFFDAAQ